MPCGLTLATGAVRWLSQPSFINFMHFYSLTPIHVQSISLLISKRLFWTSLDHHLLYHLKSSLPSSFPVIAHLPPNPPPPSRRRVYLIPTLLPRPSYALLPNSTNRSDIPAYFDLTLWHPLFQDEPFHPFRKCLIPRRMKGLAYPWA